MPERRARRPILLIALLMAALPWGCGPAEETGEPTRGGGPGDHGPAIVYRMPQDPPTLDPHDAADENSNLYAFNIFDGLVEFAPGSLEIAPAVASSWEISGDGLTYTFHLREGVTFHNGRELTSDDVVFSLQRVLKQGKADPRDVLMTISGAAAWAEGKADSVAGLSAPDPRTVVMALERPASPFLAALATQAGSIVPREVYDVEEDGYLRAPVGSGPFRLTEYVSGLRLTLEAFEDHWKGAPAISAVTVRIIPDVMTALLEYGNGQIDILNEVPAGRRREIRTERPSEYMVAPRLATAYLILDHSGPPFAGNLSLRRAVHHAINRQRIVRDFQEGKDQATTWILPPGFGLMRAAVMPEAHDPEKAAALVAEAGFPGGRGLPEITLLTPENESIRNWCEAVAHDLRAAGFKVSLRGLAFGAYFQALMAAREAGPADAIAAVIWFAGYPDPEAMIQQLFHSESPFNFGLYSNPEVDRLLDRAGLETDPEARLKLYLEAESAILNDAGAVPVYHQGDDLLVQPRIQGIHLSPLGDFAIPLELAKAGP